MCLDVIYGGRGGGGGEVPKLTSKGRFPSPISNLLVERVQKQCYKYNANVKNASVKILKKTQENKTKKKNKQKQKKTNNA